MQLTVTRLYTEPKLSPARPESSDMTKEWYVWFRFFDVSTNTWKQLRFKKGINQYHVFKERLAEGNALKQAIKEELREGWNPLLADETFAGNAQPIKIFSIEESINYILKIKEATLRKKTRYAYRYITSLFLEWAKAKNLLATGIKYFTGSQAQEYMDWMLMKKGYSGRTFNDHLIVLRTFFNCFVERDWITKNPFRSVKRKTQTVGRNLAYTGHEKAELIKALKEKDPRMYYFSQIMFHTFIRRTELTCIKVKHIDMVNHTIIIPGENAKNNSQESVVIPKDLEPILKEMNLQNYPSEYYLFGRRLMTCSDQFKNPDHISTRHNNIVKALNIDGEKGLYSWKHTGVCHYYYLTKKDIYAVMRQLRHRDLNTTMIYLKSLGLIQNDAFRNAMVA